MAGAFFMKLIGITGGIGTGKSTVCKVLEAMGYPVYYSDLRAKYLQQNDPEIIRETVLLLGEEAYIGKELNRPYIAQKIFQDSSLREKLNAIVHPRVKADFETWRKEQTSTCIFQESALIFEINRQHIYDRVVLVTAPEELRIQRVVKRDQSNPNEVKARIQAQMSDEEKRKFNPFEIVNDNEQSVLDQLLGFLKTNQCYSTSS